MSGQRKYIIRAFILFAFVFITGFLITRFVSERQALGCGTVSNSQIPADTSIKYNDGKKIFTIQCASCHILGRDATGPDLTTFMNRGPWTDKRKIIQYLTDPVKFYIINKTEYVVSLYNYSEVKHPAFIISEEQVDAVTRYMTNWTMPVIASE